MQEQTSMLNNSIVIIDNNHSISDELFSKLKENGNHIIQVEDGMQGMEMIRSTNPILIICHTMIPKLNAFSLCMLLKNDEKYKHIKIMLITDSADPDDENLAFNINADYYFSMPLNQSHFIMKVNEALTEQLAAKQR